MEGKFDEDGFLVIKRGVRWVNQHCPMNTGESNCGEHCPLVSEPIRQINKKSERTETVIHICQGRHWKFTAFEDRRSV